MQASMIRPKTGVSIALFRGGDVLLVKRGKEPFKGFWSLPGGLREKGETPVAAARRELLEETGLVAGKLGFVEFFEPASRQADDNATAQFVLAVYAGRPESGTEQAGGDTAELRWHPVGSLRALRMTPDAAQVIARAALVVS